MIANYREGFRHRSVAILGAIHSVCGSLGLIFGIVHGALCRSPKENGGTLLWPNLIIIVSGTTGLLAAKRKTKSYVILHMVLAIVSAILASSLCLMDIFMAAYLTTYPEEKGSVSEGSCNVMAVIATVSSFYGFEAVVSVISASLCCKTVCCVSGVKVVYTQLTHRSERRTDGQETSPLAHPIVSNNDYVMVNCEGQGRGIDTRR